MSVKDSARFPCRVSDQQRGLTPYVTAAAVGAAVWRLINAMLSDPAQLASAFGAKFEDDQAREPGLQQAIDRREASLRKTAGVL